MKVQILICTIPDHILFVLKQQFLIEKGECFTNCGLATILTKTKNKYSTALASLDYEINYTLGTLTPPGHETVGHAWLKATHDQSTKIWDPTLQINSRLWNSDPTVFRYVAVREFSANQLLEWLWKKYPNRPMTPQLIPAGLCRFPVISDHGIIE